MTNEQIIDIFRESHVLMEGHFILSSDRHSNRYMQCAKLFRNAKYAEPICRELADKFRGESPDVVIGPAMGAVQLAYEVGRQLGCENFFTERNDEGKMILRRGFKVTPGMKVLLVEDVITTGGSVKEVAALVNAAGGEVIGFGCVVDRSCGNINFQAPLKSVISMDITSWDAEDCPLCASGVPAVKPGSHK